jgi:hypothetical protein
MALSWLDFSNGDALSIIRDKLNTFNNTVTSDVNSKTTDIVNNTTNIASNTSAIGNNTTNIANNTTAIGNNTANITSNTTAIGDLDTRVVALEATPVLTYDYSKITNFTVTGDTYEIMSSVATPPRDAGTYEFKFSGTYTLDSTTSSAYIRFSIDGGATWTETRREPKDKTDATTFYYAFPKQVAAGNINVIVEVRKENVGDELIFQFFDIIVERKGV